MLNSKRSVLLEGLNRILRPVNDIPLSVPSEKRSDEDVGLVYEVPAVTVTKLQEIREARR